MNQRAQQVLKILVERYIQDGCPVGSKTLAEESSLGLSPATIRHILADLEEGGYLTSPHTSAGRMPTELGYRLFVNSLLSVGPLQQVDIKALEDKLNPDQEVSHLVQSASSLLSGLTKLIGIVSLPRRNRSALRQVEFLALTGCRVLVILVLNDREVQNRIIYTDKSYTQSELQEAANFLNTHYAGKDLVSARQALFQAMREDRDHMERFLQTALDIANKAFVTSDEQNKDYVIAGQNHALHYIQEGNLERLKVLFDTFSQKQEILALLDHAIEAEGVQIFIGKESGYHAFDDYSIVTTSYSAEGQVIGSLGVIGPQRMPYDRVISAVDVTAKLLSAALNQG